MSAVTTSEFETEVVKSEIPVLVDFWAVWCSPCRQIAPLIEALSVEYEGRAKVLKCNVDEEPDIAGKYNIMNIPTLLFFKGGKVVDQVIGAASKPAIAGKIDSLL